MTGWEPETWLDLSRWNGPGAALAILVIAAAVALGLETVHRIVFRRLAARTASTYDDTVFALIHPPIRDSVVIVGFILALSRVGWSPGLVDPLRRIGLSIGIVLWTLALIRILSVTVRRISAHGRIRMFQSRTVPLFDTVQKVLLTGAAVYAVFLIWSIDVTAWLASAGIIGIAVGFAAKDTLANLFSGVFILVDAPYRIGDMIVLDTGERGRVTDVGIRSTRILTRDDVEITIPNATIGAAKIMNETGGPTRKRRVDVKVGVSYASDPVHVSRVLEEVIRGLDIVCDDPEPRARFREMGDSALIFSVLFWIRDPEEKGLAVHIVTTRVFQRLREEGIEIPFPQRVVHWAGSAPPPPA